MDRPLLEGTVSRKNVFDYQLDVITNGSEGLEPTVFLSVLRHSETCNHSEDGFYENPNAIRYAVLGLSEMTARLVADQKFSWAKTNAMFCHNNHRHSGGFCPFVGVNGGGLWGLPSILLALHQAGAPQLTVVTGNQQDASRTEEVVDLLEARKSHPQVRVCAVPLTKEKDNVVNWWKVYEDPYLLVHGTCSGGLENLIYLFTCRKHSAPNYTIAVLPCPHAWHCFLHIWGAPENRVVLEEEKDNGESSGDLCVGMILAVGNNQAIRPTFLSKVEALLPGTKVFFCQSQERDNRVLLQATELVEAWNAHVGSAITWRPPTSSCMDNQCYDPPTGVNLPSCCSVLCTEAPTIVDRSTSILNRTKQKIPNPEDVDTLKNFLKIKVLESAAGKVEDGVGGDEGDANEIDIDGLDDDSQCSSNSNDVWRHVTGESVNRTKADADVAPSSTIESAASQAPTQDPLPAHQPIHQPHLLILGTGCASPSALRGSSSYGLLLPQVPKRKESGLPLEEVLVRPCEELLLTAIFECGEGTLSMLLRHLPLPKSSPDISESLLDIHLRHVKFLWISHAHYDHYGGLPAVVSRIHEAQLRHHHSMAQVGEASSKRSKIAFSEPPVLIVAPSKVLNYLKITLDASSAKSNSTPLFQGYTHEQMQSWWPYLACIQIARVPMHPSENAKYCFTYRPFDFWTNIRVEHSCFKAFGFVCGINVPLPKFTGDTCGEKFTHHQANTQKITLAYSGDTRPCWGFVERCVRDCNSFASGNLSYLIHEATFNDEDEAKSREKMHSSLSEALKVANDVGAKKVILTHFSQRYVQYPPMQLDSAHASLKKPMVFALDGMLIPLQ